METFLEVEYNMNSKNWLYLLELFLKNKFNPTQEKIYIYILIKATDCIRYFESFTVNEMEIRAPVLPAEMHCITCMCVSHIIRYTFRQKGNVLQNGFIQPYHIPFRFPQAHDVKQSA